MMAKLLADLRDILLLPDGQSLNARVLNKTFTIKTSFGRVTVMKGEIVHIIMQRGLPHELITNSSNILKGQIQDKECNVLIFTGKTVTFKLPQEVLSIVFLDNVHPMLKKKISKSGMK